MVKTKGAAAVENNGRVKSMAALVWSIAELLRGDFKQSEYGKVILPFVVLRRLDCLLEPTKEKVLKKKESLREGMDERVRAELLFAAAGGDVKCYNLSEFTFAKLKAQDPKHIHKNLLDYISKFSPAIRDVFLNKFKFTEQLKRLKDAGLLYQVFEKFAEIDLHPNVVQSHKMGYLFEELIRRFSEISNETAGEHYTPREVIGLIVSLLLENDRGALAGRGIIRRIYDPAAGTGGMLAIAEAEMKSLNSGMRVELYGQELNDESFAICKSDMLVKGHKADNIASGNSLTEDAHAGGDFHYMLSNPPYGVEWKKYADPIKKEAQERGMRGRFGAGLPRISDGQLLFLQHMIAKMRNDEQGSRIGIVMNGSPLFTGGAGSGESEIRRWMFENDWVEAIIALPADLFYNTGIQTYVWLLTNRKSKERQGKVQLINANGERFWKPLRKSLGSKRKEIPPEARELIVKIYAEMLNGGGKYGEFSKVLTAADFAHREVRVERPLRLSFVATAGNVEALKLAKPFLKLAKNEQKEILACFAALPQGKVWMSRDKFLMSLGRAKGVKINAPIERAIIKAFSRRNERAEICRKANGDIEPDVELRDHELVPLGEKWQTYFKREVLPFVPDAWVDESYVDEKDGKVGRVGYEINFNRYFYKYAPPRPLAKIDAEIKSLEAEIVGLLKES